MFVNFAQIGFSPHFDSASQVTGRAVLGSIILENELDDVSGNDEFGNIRTELVSGCKWRSMFGQEDEGKMSKHKGPLKAIVLECLGTKNVCLRNK
ncbi:hypothetical protein L596_006845 [Steinernema carpocapsae]|uniref:Uncharacterized protein n=1 Tax=Steinernema carpocapsae TaxID=34508 RepID=A0A4U5P865_STECR|nr:hypothetical protein L596_006845 [Steinernema carpocapsae]